MRLFPKGALVFEIGACIGDMAEALLHHGAGWVIALEPEEEDCSYMRDRFKDYSNVIIKSMAIGPEWGLGTLAINKGARSCSTLVPDVAWGKDTLLSEMQVNEYRTVQVTTLDRLIDEYGIPDYVNMSIVRFEYQALLGLTQPLPRLSFAVTHATIDEGWALKAIDRIIEISPSSRFNYTNRSALIDDAQAPLRWPRWKDAQSIKKIFPEINERGLWGHVQVKMYGKDS